VGPLRVWLKNEEIPGLAMTRSFGDQIAASVGVLAEPEITEWKFTNEDKFLILASDGVWEFIESEEVKFISNYSV
jgi:serine/threonine protein phosphatase PrpC